MCKGTEVGNVNARSEKCKGDVKACKGAPPHTEGLWEHQRGALGFIAAAWEAGQRGVLLNAHMGAGKTLVAIRALAGLFAEWPNVPRALIVVPKAVAPVWPQQIAQWWPGQPPVVMELSDGSTAKRAAQLRHQVSLGRPFVAVANYDAVWRGDLGKTVMQVPWTCVVGDEVHRAKAAAGVMSRYLSRLGPRVPHRLGLTGTLLPQSHLDAYAVLRFLDPRIFGTSYVAFKTRYTRPAVTSEDFKRPDVLFSHNRGALTKIVPHNMDDFARRLATVTYTISADVLDLPSLVETPRYCELELQAAKVYRDLERDLIADIEAGRITAANALVRVLRLQQVTSGRVPTDEGNGVAISRVKERLLEDVLGDLEASEPAVVFGRFAADLDAVHRAAEATGRTSLELSGRRNELAAWQDGEASVLAVQVQAGGVGVSMTRARYVLWYSLPWSLAQYDQAVARLHRPGQERGVVSVPLIARGTIDERVALALRERREIIAAIVDDIKQR